MAPTEASSLLPAAASTGPDGERVPSPWCLRTETHSFVSLALLVVAMSFLVAPMSSWQLFEPVMLDKGVFICNANNGTHDQMSERAAKRLNEYAPAHTTTLQTIRRTRQKKCRRLSASFADGADSLLAVRS